VNSLLSECFDVEFITVCDRNSENRTISRDFKLIQCLINITTGSMLRSKSMGTDDHVADSCGPITTFITRGTPKGKSYPVSTLQ
jgi:hypothetical protein